MENFSSGVTIGGSPCTGTICGRETSEPITEEVRNQRETASCTLDNVAVNAISPLGASNPQNVKNVEAIFPESKFNEFLPTRDAAYTYTNFLKAIGKYPSICATTEHCPKILANMFGHFQQETAGLVYLEEINKSPYCADWSAWVNEAYPCASASMWFYVTPQPPKPSMLQVLDGSWTPNSADQASNLVPGFGVTTMIINGALECGSWNQQAQNRATYYTDYAAKLGVDITGEKLTCSDMAQFSSSGSAGQMKLYWGPS